MLFDYQFNGLLWMYLKERAVLSKQKFVIGCNDMRFTNESNVKCNVLYDCRRRLFLPTFCQNANKNVESRKQRNSENSNSNSNNYNNNNNNNNWNNSERNDNNNNNDNSTTSMNEMDQRLSEMEWFTPRTLSFRGGIVADDVGLGKTLTMLSLILSHPKDHDITSNSYENNTYKINDGNGDKALKCDATLVIVPSHLVEQWEHELVKHFKPHVMKCIKICCKLDHRKVTYKDILEAQIVIVSAQYLMRPYYDDLRKNLDHEWNNFINPSLPPVPPNYFINMKKKNDDDDEKMGSDKNNKTGLRRSHRITQKKFKHVKPKEKKKKTKKYHYLGLDSPILSLFHWHRIILDEASDYLLKLREKIWEITSTFRWYVSATPFPEPQLIGLCAEFLEIEFDNQDSDEDYFDWNDYLDMPLGYILHCIFYYHLFSKYTISTIGSDNNYLPSISTIVDYVEFHPLETLFYNIIKLRRGSKYQDKKLERCICAGLWNYFQRESFFHGSVFFGRSERCQKFNDVMDKLKKLQRNKNKTAIGTTVLQCLVEINRIYYSISNEMLELDLQKEKESLENLLNTKKNFESQENEKKEQKKQQDKEKKKRRDFKKFHKKQVDARDISKQIERISSLIERRQNNIDNIVYDINLNKKELLMLNNDELENKINTWENNFKLKYGNDEMNSYLLSIIGNYGAKQAYLLTFVKKLVDSDDNNKVIIFSLFHQILIDIRKRLEAIGIDAAVMAGNVQRRRIAMSAFETKRTNNSNSNSNNNKRKRNVKVILISIKHAASGADLTQATHVILCDPVPGSSSQAYAAERQAVGRAVRQGMAINSSNGNKIEKVTKVIRLVVKDTIEHETHLRNEQIRNNLKQDSSSK